MRITTTAGELSVVQATDDAELVVVTGHKDSLQALVDGIEMSGAGSRELTGVVYNSRYVGSMIVSKLQLAIWVQFEILNYLTYTELPRGEQA